MTGLVKNVLEINENIKILTAVVQYMSNHNSESFEHALPDEIKLPLRTLE